MRLMSKIRIFVSACGRMVHTEATNSSTASIMSSIARSKLQDECKGLTMRQSMGQDVAVATALYTDQDVGDAHMHQIGENVSRKDKIKFLFNILVDLKDSKEAIYGALDAWVAWEKNFPIASIKMVLLSLEKEQQWHRIIQVIKWMLNKGQGRTMGTYHQLIKALDMDHRAEEAHGFWVSKIGNDLHSVPWQLCILMISVYYRNNMLERLLKLFRGLEAFDRKPPDKSIVQRVADAYEMLGLLEEKRQVLEKYKDLFNETTEGGGKKNKASFAKKKKSGRKKGSPPSNRQLQIASGDDAQADEDD